MAGETIKSRAVCLRITPWSRTSHIVTWLTPSGKVTTVVKGAVRPKSQTLGAYDLNYTCDILYYARANGELHALRECVPVEMRERLRGDYRALAVAEYCRFLVERMVPEGAEANVWMEKLTTALDELTNGATTPEGGERLVSRLLAFELAILELIGLKPDFSDYDRNAEWSVFSIEMGNFGKNGHLIRISSEVAEYLMDVTRPQKNPQIPLDAARVIGVFYHFHLDCASDVRRAVLRMISKPTNQKGTQT